MAVVYRHRVKYHEADAQGYLFNGRFLELADVGMVEFLRGLGWSYERMNAAGADPSVVHVEIDFEAPALFDDDLDVDVVCTRVGGSSFELVTIVLRGDEVLARIGIVYVNVDTQVHRSRPLPSDLADTLHAAVGADSASDAGSVHS